ncbi:uncharacterized mitochondrial protein AtMg00810-like [Solanum stenotomum]|uniref:uncharacterized mitochondrial protein AtMg00810-like n=1 Tax=Solanum stenotomum TaxID=172797 RepID=UPI0020D1DA08|nr:uncharacterized mitochondrial protein AtMg00810-like [Solanum stenotomum]
MGLSGAKPVSTPLDPNLKLTSIEYDIHVQGSGTIISNMPLKDVGRYQRLVRRLLYLTMTRVDISFAVQTLSQFMHAPKESHMEAALRVVKYIKTALGLGTCVQTRKSITRYLVKFGDALITWKSNKQETVARSSAEAEFRSMASAVAEITWLIGVYKELGGDYQTTSGSIL